MTPEHPDDPNAVIIWPTNSDQPIWVDPETFVKYGHLNWWLNSGGYPTTSVSGKPVSLHRLVCRAAPDLEVDHVNRNPRDARLANLRPATHAQNCANRARSRVSPMPRGVAKHVSKSTVYYQATVGNTGSVLWSACFRTEADAVLARDKMALKFYGDFAILNLPREYVESQPMPRALSRYARPTWGTVPYRGVSRHTSGKYAAELMYQKQRIWLGLHHTPEEAARARDRYIIEHDLPHKLNFSREQYETESEEAYLELAGD